MSDAAQVGRYSRDSRANAPVAMTSFGPHRRWPLPLEPIISRWIVSNGPSVKPTEHVPGHFTVGLCALSTGVYKVVHRYSGTVHYTFKPYFHSPQLNTDLLRFSGTYTAYTDSTACMQV